ncbi:putative E3 ubiquitin-protein ligase RING1a [Andrographis paniculata]|uniref:putative E3 ubiquitin-protein ligase RING1a n=1 Tax=Andrographis paniculata TaxID=175694 RepID=UPI0021E8C0B2|nr:putative E3 ubiquitin-protein ligase RING1a [Andrographis paniculata]
MPAQKRPLEMPTPPPSPPQPPEEEKPDDLLKDSENQTENAADSDESDDSSDGENEEFISVNLAEIRKEVQCPICLGIIRKTRTVMECLHRFCRECIDKSMRLGNNECPACRTHCASRRSLRDDPNYDALIAALYPDIDKYEEEELAFHEEEQARNKQIQATIAQTFRRQAEALGKKRTSSRVTAASYLRRQDNYRNLRGRRNHRVAEHQGSDGEEGANGHDGSKDSSSADERTPEVKSRRSKRWGTARASQKVSGSNADGSYVDNESEGPNGNSEILPWGKGGMRSNTRHAGPSWANGNFSRNRQISKLITHLKSSKENNQFNIGLTLVSLEENIPRLKRPYLCCSPTFTVAHLCLYIAMQTSMDASGIEILIAKDFQPGNSGSSFNNNHGILNLSENELQLLNVHQTMQEIHGSFTRPNLVLAYRKKAEGKETATGNAGALSPKKAAQS